MNSQGIQEYLKKIRENSDFISSDVLEPIHYDNKNKNTWVEIENPEFTSLCPRTGLPDYGTITIKYLPDKYVVELKSLKLYFLQFRNTGIFYENLNQLILDHLTKVIQPIEMIIQSEFTPRGGITTRVTSTFKKK
ncbi:MAG: NADPH-dependent 7-cyano-7-deazaguanine reductase QueF [Candidatus Aminicenantes bacterium]|nr:NADPH-dependent 7-cyano-7-deazaguanine reductase QueF [Candidatus Aminicenantes bacterium]